MKKSTPLISSAVDGSRRGAALVVVLAVIVLVLGLVVAFLNLAKTERRSAAAYLAGTEVRQLADNAVGIVQAQINYATSQGASVAWASQPGMIRTYNQSGQLDTAYKLYSASVLTDSTVNPSAADVPTSGGWASEPAHWVDLNTPVTANGREVFPIVDPSLLDEPAWLPEEFAITGAPVASGAPRDRAPMPVRWLYVLKEGQIVAPTGSGTTAMVPGASDENPITGRIAFWTDDETSKVNVNTAGAGAFWDVPRFNSTEERKFASSQPLNGEFQRYPGHPAMTSLNAVFPDIGDQEILSLVTPRYQWGGSQQGQIDTFSFVDALNNGNVADLPLYASVDELRFARGFEDRTQNALFPRERIEMARFFLTHSSRAPEINLFNLPRITTWPIANDASGRTPFDDIIAFASTIGGEPYYFQRRNALSPTEDAAIPRNQQLFGYLQYLTNQTVPGFGVRLADKFGIDRDQILTAIWDYIRSSNLFDSRLSAGQQFTAGVGVEGYGYVVPLETGSSSDPNRGFGRGITLSELAFGFICTADPVDTERTPPGEFGMRDSNDPARNRTLEGEALEPGQRRIQMILVPEFFAPSQGNIFIRPRHTRLRISGLSGLRLGGEELFSTNEAEIRLGAPEANFSAGHHSRRIGGPFDLRAAINYRRSPSSFETGSRPVYPFISNFVTISVPNPGTEAPGAMVFESGELVVTIETSVDGSNWRVAQRIPINPPSPQDIPIPNLVRVGTAGTDASTEPTPATDEKYWWAYSFERPWTGAGPSAGGRLRNLHLHPGTYNVSATTGIPRGVTPNAGVIFSPTEAGSDYYTDVVRSMVPSHGDNRLIAALRDVPANAFTPLENWGLTGARHALIHTLGTGRQDPPDTPGGNEWRRHYVTSSRIGLSTTQGAGGRFAPDFRSDAAQLVLNQLQATGDFDNGLALHQDGAFINKPDEGNVTGAGGIPYFATTDREEIDSEAFFSPNRMIAGPGMFGSLPTHVKRYAADPGNPDRYAWLTLLFRPHPGHPNVVTLGAGGLPSAAPDHLLMDLFWMPVVEPYAISEPFSTAGKVNMNYQIEPFRYIKRPTAIAAALREERIAAVPTTATDIYKDSSAQPASSFRLRINIPATLEQFETRFNNASGRIFLSPTEMCDLWLVPEGQSLAGMPAFWNNHRLTGDNMRERPYATLIPRLTTKSNTFTVHFRVQALRPGTGGDATVWDEDQGTITSEYRGATMIERFIALDDPVLATTDFATATASRPTLDAFYRWRVIQTRQFAP